MPKVARKAKDKFLPKVRELTAARRGGYVARRPLPRDVAEAYGKQFGKGKPPMGGVVQ
jgi:hypothetical protein